MCRNGMLREDQALTFPDGGGLLLAANAVDDDQDFVGANGGIAAKILVVDANGENAIADHGAEAIGDVDGSTLHAVVAAEDEEVAAVILTAGPVVPGTVITAGAAIVPIIARHGKEARFDGTALLDVKLAFFISAVFCENTESFVFADGRITAHGLIVDGNAAIDAAAGDKVAQYAGDIGTLVSESIVGTLNQPDFVLSSDAHREKGDAGGEKKG